MGGESKQPVTFGYVGLLMTRIGDVVRERVERCA